MKKTILIVDDDEALRDNLKDILDDEGYDLQTASNCAEALGLAAAEKPQVALLDLKLPDDSGINLLARLRQIHPDCICALMTAFADVDSAVAALHKGAFHYLQKPVRPVELINLLERIFETVSIKQEKRRAEEKLRESEKRFRTIVESAQDAIFLKDASLRYTLVNPVMERIYGLSADAFIGRTDEDLFGAEDGEKNRRSEVRVLQGEVVEDEWMRMAGGVPRTFHSIKIPLRADSGQITGLCGFTRDLTATRQLEAQLLQAQKMEAIGILAGGISHDFNNLLQVIQGYSQILLIDKNADDPDWVKLTEIEKAARRANELTRQLLAFGRKVAVELRPIDVNYTVRQIEKLLKRTIPKMIDIELDLADPVATVNADPGQLEQVLLNIGLNARDAMPDGGKLIFRTAGCNPDEVFRKVNLEDGAGPYVLIGITDSGHGMADDVMDHIFEPFFTTKQMGKGTGLGLAMAYGIIKKHHGHIACESRPGAGTTFTIYLPAIDLVAPREIEAAKESIPKGHGEWILLVDDESYILDLMKDMLVKNGYRVFTAASGEEGLVLYREHQKVLSLIILDLIMPGMGGKRCMAEILNLNPQARIMIASGYALDDIGESNVLIKAQGFLQKPYDFVNMLQLIRKVISQGA
jgi:PAS domain S-box-containing protein